MVSLNEAPVVVISVVVLVIVLGIGATVLEEVEETQCEDQGWYFNETNGGCWDNNTNGSGTARGSYAVNATLGGLSGVQTYEEWVPTIAVIIVSALVIGIISMYFYMRR